MCVLLYCSCKKAREQISCLGVEPSEQILPLPIQRGVCGYRLNARAVLFYECAAAFFHASIYPDSRACQNCRSETRLFFAFCGVHGHSEYVCLNLPPESSFCRSSRGYDFFFFHPEPFKHQRTFLQIMNDALHRGANKVRLRVFCAQPEINAARQRVEHRSAFA